MPSRLRCPQAHEGLAALPQAKGEAPVARRLLGASAATTSLVAEASPASLVAVVGVRFTQVASTVCTAASLLAATTPASEMAPEQGTISSSPSRKGRTGRGDARGASLTVVAAVEAARTAPRKATEAGP